MLPRRTLSIGNFFAATYFYLVIYVSGPYLATFLPDTQTGLVITIGAVITLAGYPFMPKVVARFGARYCAIGVASIAAVTLFVLAAQPSFWLAAGCLALIFGISPFIQYFMDLLLEATGALKGEIGRIRTLFLTAGNIALILTPLLISFFIDGTNEYWRIFLVAGISLAPFITLFLFQKLPEQYPKAHRKLLESCNCLITKEDVRAVIFGNGVLQFFYHLAPLYIPLYLHGVLGIPWSELGWMFTVMLIPFVLIEYPAGYISDKWIGEKELLIAGYIIMSISFGALGFVTVGTPLWILVGLLITTRIGAALVEAMVEGHFFKLVSVDDANTVTVYRMSRPVAALAAPLSASILLALTGSYLIFFTTMGAILLLAGIGSTYFIVDER